ncbi:MAG TPA: hypothetical protein DEG71_05785 [Clostridiales bacterium]|nr:hypothetical protein [Clostridiales bacterium]
MDICVGLDWKDNRPSVEEVDNYNSRMKDIKDFLQALYDEKHSGYYKIMYKAIKMTGNNSEYAMLQLFDCFLHHLWT